MTRRKLQTRAELKSEDDTQEDELLLACHARQMLPTSGFLRKCEVKFKRTLVILKLKAAAVLVPMSGHPADYLDDRANDAGVSPDDVSDALALPAGVLDRSRPTMNQATSKVNGVSAARRVHADRSTSQSSESGERRILLCLEELGRHSTSEDRKAIEAACQNLKNLFNSK